MARPGDERASPGERLGVFGGTFDPPHTGHQIVVADVADRLELDRVLWIPAAAPPHKSGAPLTAASLRLEMVSAAVLSDDRFSACDLELRRPGPSYTVDTLAALARERPDDALFLIMGVDQYRELGSWSRPGEILERATLVVMDREGEAPRDAVPDVPGAEAAVHTPVRRLDVSSTRVREAVAAGEAVADMVPPGVLEIIEREGLYRR